MRVRVRTDATVAAAGVIRIAVMQLTRKGNDGGVTQSRLTTRETVPRVRGRWILTFRKLWARCRSSVRPRWRAVTQPKMGVTRTAKAWYWYLCR